MKIKVHNDLHERWNKEKSEILMQHVYATMIVISCNLYQISALFILYIIIYTELNVLIVPVKKIQNNRLNML